MNRTYEQIAKQFKAFCDDNRLKILDLLSHGEKCACVLLEELHIAQPTLSHHLKILCDSGMVKGRREGKWIHYSLDEKNCKQAIDFLQEFLVVKNDLPQTCSNC